MDCVSSSYRPPREYNKDTLLWLTQAAEEGLDLLSNESLEDDVNSVLNPSQAARILQDERWKLEPEWLDRFMKTTFFEPCPEHDMRRNDLNQYCIECDSRLCLHCPAAPHKDHRTIKLYRHVYKDVIPICELVMHLDCSQIQPYRCNKHRSLAMTPLPHSGSKNSKVKDLCRICKRKLTDSTLYRYCSITCKVEAFRTKEDFNSPPFLLYDFPEVEVEVEVEAEQEVEQPNEESEVQAMNLDQPAEKTNEEPEANTLAQSAETENPKPVISYRKRNRKGIPIRAPLF